MEKNNEERSLIDNSKDQILTTLISLPGWALLFAGVYTIYTGGKHSFHPILENINLAYIFAVIGVVLIIWGSKRTIKLSKERKQLLDE